MARTVVALAEDPAHRAALHRGDQAGPEGRPATTPRHR
jgi:hypothetical protein